jgi:hypothetical protein
MARDVILLSHAALVGLTPLIPVPLVDDAVKGFVERRMAGELVRENGLELDKDTTQALVEEPSGSLLASMAKGALTFPLKLVFRKVFFVLEVKRAADEASRTYHKGLLLDLALRAGALAPKGPKSADDIRKAIEATCQEVGVSPVSVPMRAVFEASKDGLERAGRRIFEGLSKTPEKVGDAEVKDAVEGAAADRGFVDELVARLRAATDTVPREHFDALRASFAKKLGVELPSTDARG